MIKVVNDRGWVVDFLNQPLGSVTSTCQNCRKIGSVYLLVEVMEDAAAPLCDKCAVSYVMERWPHLGEDSDGETVVVYREPDKSLNALNGRIGNEETFGDS